MPMHLDHGRRCDGNTDHAKPYKITLSFAM
jgi:hypothetical protein